MIEILKKEDLNKYKELIDACFGSSTDLINYEKYMESSNYTILVFKENEKIIGSVTYYKIELFTFGYYPAVQLFNVCVLPEYRKNNIAAKLIEEVEVFCKNNGYKQMFINCLEQLGGFYEKIGFTKDDSVKYIKMVF
ncbi:MAG: GNAT family N-acetyltransferase [Mollicutes bacterium]|nr:GNAT family N-acetyltransferase [Mollicutes bacterium]